MSKFGISEVVDILRKEAGYVRFRGGTGGRIIGGPAGRRMRAANEAIEVAGKKAKDMTKSERMSYYADVLERMKKNRSQGQ